MVGEEKSICRFPEKHSDLKVAGKRVALRNRKRSRTETIPGQCYRVLTLDT